MTDFYIILGIITLVVLLACLPSRKELASWRPTKRVGRKPRA